MRTVEEIAELPYTHRQTACAGEWCSIHNPSDHHMASWRLLIRYDRSCMAERICPHGVGHPDPDSMAYFRRVGIDDVGVHGCDGCCVGDP